MIFGAIVLLAVGLLFLVFAILIYRGKTELIHSYHQTRVKDKKAYGRAFGKAMGVISAGLLAAGMLSFFVSEAVGEWLIPALLAAGMLVGFVMIFFIQKKYNQGLF